MAQVLPDYYFKLKYLSLGRFISYFYQVDSIYKLVPKSVLFIGVGDGSVPHLLKHDKNLQITTLDIDPSLNPDVVGDVKSLPLPDKSFDMVCAFEVLEHLPYEEMLTALKELSRVSRRDVVISVPHRRIGFEFVFRFPFIRSIFKKDFLRVALYIPIRFRGFASSGQHYWEIDGHTTRLGDFRAAIRERFNIAKEVTPVLDFYKRFFYLTVI